MKEIVSKNQYVASMTNMLTFNRFKSRGMWNRLADRDSRSFVILSRTTSLGKNFYTAVRFSKPFDEPKVRHDIDRDHEFRDHQL